MNIDDFEREIAALRVVYENEGDDASTYLEFWLNAKNLTEAEITFFIYLVKNKFEDERLMNLDRAEVDKDYELLHQLKVHALIQLLGDLRKQTHNYQLILRDIDVEFLSNPHRKALFDAAESFAFNHGLIDGTGRWTGKQNERATFLSILIREKVLSNAVSRKDIDQYFAKRYLCDPIGDQFKPSKLAKNNNEGKFSLLLKTLKDSPN